MDIQVFESYFLDEKTLDKALEALKDDITRIEYYSQSFSSGTMLENPMALANAMIELTGLYMSLRPKLAIASTYKENNQLKHYYNAKANTPKDIKFVDASTEKEASYSVSAFRRVRNLIEGYVEAIEKSMGMGQSLLKALQKEHEMPVGD